jgi:hypothetical protein
MSFPRRRESILFVLKIVDPRFRGDDIDSIYVYSEHILIKPSNSRNAYNFPLNFSYSYKRSKMAHILFFLLTVSSFQNCTTARMVKEITLAPASYNELILLQQITPLAENEFRENLNKRLSFLSAAALQSGEHIRDIYYNCCLLSPSSLWKKTISTGFSTPLRI